MHIIMRKRQNPRRGANEVRRSLSAFFLAFCAMAFACLVLCGASRLIAGAPEGEKPADMAEPAQAYFISPAAESLCQADKQTPLRCEIMPAVCVRQAEASLPRVQRDANGNVLSGVSYLRAVYQAFALGDGFA